MKVQYGNGLSQFQENLTHDLPSIGFADQEYAVDEVRIFYGAPLTETQIQQIADRIMKTGPSSGDYRMTAKDNVVDFRVIRLNEKEANETFITSKFLGREVKSLLPPEYTVVTHLCDEVWNPLMSAPIESGNGQLHDYGNNFLFTSGDLTEQEIDGFVDQMNSFSLYDDDSDWLNWLRKSNGEVTLCVSVKEPSVVDETFDGIFSGLSTVLNEVVFKDSSFRMVVSDVDGIEVRQVWPKQ